MSEWPKSDRLLAELNVGPIDGFLPGVNRRSISWCLSVVLGCLLAYPGLAGTTDATETPIAPRTRMRLFNGRDLAGFTTWLVDTHHADPRGVFSVTNGMIHISGDGLGYLATRNRFRDYRLIVEWRWGRTNTPWGDRLGRARDSGVFLHATGSDGNSRDGKGAFMAAIECNVFEGAVGDFLLIRGSWPDGSPIAPRVVVETAPDVDKEGWPTWSRGDKIGRAHV